MKLGDNGHIVRHIQIFVQNLIFFKLPPLFLNINWWFFETLALIMVVFCNQLVACAMKFLLLPFFVCASDFSGIFPRQWHMISHSWITPIETLVLSRTKDLHHVWQPQNRKSIVFKHGSCFQTRREPQNSIPGWLITVSVVSCELAVSISNCH